MAASDTEPVIVFLAFANDRVDPDRHLRSLADEQRQVRAALEAAEQAGHCEIVERANATLTEILDVFQNVEYRNRIAIFHFGGHAGDAQLFLESPEGEARVAHAAGLARFLGEQRGLELVFLNGCSSRGQTQGLLDAGISAVLATSEEIDDARATEFSVRFYKSLASGQPIRTGYREAAAAVETRHGESTRDETRGRDERDAGGTPSHGLPWDLYHLPGADERLGRWSLPAAAHDPLFGLPPLPERDLPARPFKHLEWFTADDAEVFFGRGHEIRRLYEAVTLEDASPIVLLFGATGVGKSSLLAAGLLPRLEAGHAVEYVRRDGTVGLAGALSGVLGSDEDFGAAWRRREEDLGKPLVVILDQVEEAWTRPLPGGGEGAGLAATLRQIFAVRDERPRGRLILTFRKEWLAEVLDLLESARLPRPRRVELKHLDRAGIKGAVAGVARTPRLKREYGLRVADELPGIVADDLLEDQEGAIAPALQILLTKMWDRACAANPEAPAFTVELYQELKRRGILLEDFLEEQLAVIEKWRPEVVDSGLALDLLAHHTTPLGTAEVRQAADVVARYNGRTEVVELLQQCKDCFLLAGTFRTQKGRLFRDEPSEAVPESPSGTVRLAHDTLAPLIRRRFDASDLPGQRAGRILGQRAVAWTDGKTGNVLDGSDLAVVEKGERGMPVRGPDEERLVAASRRARQRRKGLRTVVAAAIVLLAGFGFYKARQAFEAEARALDRFRVAVGTGIEDPTDRTLVLLEITEPARTPTALDWLSQTASDPVTLDVLAGHTDWVGQASFSPDGTRVITASSDGTARIWNAESGAITATLNEHTDIVWSAVFSPDGTRVVTASADHTARLWSAESGARLAPPLEGHGARVTSASFSPDGSRVVTASWDETARLWDAESGAFIAPLEGHTHRLKSASFNPDGTRVVTASVDGTARLWSAETGAFLFALDGHMHGLNSASFSPDGSQVVTASDDGTARLWDAESGVPLAPLEGHTSFVFSASFSPDGTRVLTSSDRTARLWNAQTGALLGTLAGHSGSVYSASFSPDGTQVLTASNDGTARLWNAESNASLATFTGHTDSVGSASFSPNGTRVVTASRDGTARLWNTEADASLAILEGHRDGVDSASFSPDGTRLVTASWDGTGRLWNAETGAFIRPLVGHWDSVQSASFNPNGTRVVTASHDGTVRLWNAESGKELLRLEGHTIGESATYSLIHDDAGNGVFPSGPFSPDGKRLITVSESSDNTAQLWNAQSGDKLATLEGHTRSIGSASFSPDGSRVVTGSSDYTARLWDTQSGDKLVTLAGHKLHVTSASFSPDGTQVVTTSIDGTARLWDAESGAFLEPPLAGHTHSVGSASFSPDGTRVVTASWDRNARLWSTESGAELVTLEGHTGPIGSASFSPDGTRVLTASDDGTARLWNAESGASIGTLEGHMRSVNIASFSPDGTRVVTASDDETARLWALDDLLRSLLRSRTRTCLDVEFRHSTLGETEDEACRNHAACETCTEAFFESSGSRQNADVASRLAAWNEYQSCLERERENACVTDEPTLDTSVSQ